MSSMQGKTVIVTGASRGIGAGIARHLASRGARVACAARTEHEGDHPKSPGSLETTLIEIEKLGGEAVGIRADVGVASDCERLVAEARDALGPIDVLINNAALTYFSEIADFRPDKWERSFAVNVHGPFFLSRAVLPEMQERSSGVIVNITSGASGGPGRGPYSGKPAVGGGVLYGTEKAALERFTQGLAEEVFPSGICVVALAPSAVVPTPGTAFHVDKFDSSFPTESPEMIERAAELLATAPLDRVTGRVCYSQEILLEFGWIDEGHGAGVDRPGSPYSQI